MIYTSTLLLRTVYATALPQRLSFLQESTMDRVARRCCCCHYYDGHHQHDRRTHQHRRRHLDGMVFGEGEIVLPIV